MFCDYYGEEIWTWREKSSVFSNLTVLFIFLAVSCSASPGFHLQFQVWLLLSAMGLPPPGCCSNTLFWAGRAEKSCWKPTFDNGRQRTTRTRRYLCDQSNHYRLKSEDHQAEGHQTSCSSRVDQGGQTSASKQSQVTSFTSAVQHFPNMRWEIRFTLSGHMKLMKRMTGSPTVKT